MAGLIPIINSQTSQEFGEAKKAFNKRIEQINKLKLELEEANSQISKAEARIHQEIIPIEREIIDLRIEKVKVLDSAYDLKFFKKQEKEKIKLLLKEDLTYLIQNFGLEDLKKIYNKYSETDYDKEKLIEKEKASEFFDSVFGFDPEDEDEDDFFGFVDEDENPFSGKEETRKKTAKQIEREQQLEEEEKKIKRSIKSIYTGLAKLLHPDTERDEVERKWKTEAMKEVTEAYFNKDLFKLLSLEIEYTNNSKVKDTIDDDLLVYYNKMLQEQISNLKEELYELKQGFMGDSIFKKFCGKGKSSDKKFAKEKQRLESIKEDFRSEISYLSSKENIREYLRYFKVNKVSVNNYLDDLF